MGNVIDSARQVWRKWRTDGDASSGAHNPDKEEIWGFAEVVEEEVSVVTDLINEGSNTLTEQLEDIDTAMAQAEDLQDQWSIGMPATYKFDASRDVGTTAVRILGGDDARVALWLYNADSDGGTITFTTEAGTPVYGDAGTANLTPGASVSWSATECPDGEIWAVADQEGTALTCKYSSTTNTPPGLLDVFARMTSTPNSTRKGHLRTLWNSCLAVGIDIAELEHFAVIGHTEQATLLNWPGGTMTKVSSPTFSADDYFQGDGVDDYILTGVTLPGGGFTQNSNFMACYAYNAGALGAQAMMGNSTTTNQTHFSSTTVNFRHQGTNDIMTPGGTLPAGQFMAQARDNSANYKEYFNAVTPETVTQASTAPNAVALVLLANGSSSTVFSIPTTAKWMFSAAGGCPADKDTAMAGLYAAVVVYLTAIGAI